MMKTMIAAALFLAGTTLAHARVLILDVYTMPNRAGGSIMITEDTCNSGGAWTITTGPWPDHQIRHTGCSRVRNSEVVVYWDDGVVDVYNASAFHRSRVRITR